jgi:hypothetical protein
VKQLTFFIPIEIIFNILTMMRKISVLVAIILAIGFSAFKEKKNASVFYGLKSDGVTYQRISIWPNNANCHDVADFPCEIGYNSDQGSTLNANSLPSQPTYSDEVYAIFWDN